MPDLDHPLLQGLNPPQQEAVVHTEGPLLILAGAGSGKTTVITRRIAWLIEEAGAHPSSILAMTFTNKAAEEMRERVQRLVSVPVEQLWVSTFHSFCTRILRREGERTPVGRSFVIFDPSDQKSLLKQVLAELKLPEKQFHPRKVLEFISDFKNRCLLPEEAVEEALDPWTRKAVDAYALYQQGLRNHRACDFDDLLLYTERLFRDPAMQEIYAQRFRYILVDEYQDTNHAQYKLVQHLAKHHRNLCVVGDEDQCVVEGTNIEMADGSMRRIETLKPGDEVRSAYGSGEFRSAKVLKISRLSGVSQGIRVLTNAGREVISTPSHTHFADWLDEAPVPVSASHLTLGQVDGKHGIEGQGQPRWTSSDFGPLIKIASELSRSGRASLIVDAAFGTRPLRLRLARDVEAGMALLDRGGAFDTVAKVEEVALSSAVFDLDIEGVHNYIANGLVTHNSIYGWRGADIRNILDFQRDFPGAVQIKLEQNYRSTQSILDAASTVIANNAQRLGKTLWTDRGHGEKLVFKLLDDGRLEAEYVVARIQEARRYDPGVKTAVLYRANWQSRQLEEALRGANLPYKLIGGVKFYERQEVKDLLAYLRLFSNPYDLTSFRRCVNAPSRGVGPTTLGRIEACIPEGGTPLEGLAALVRSGELKGRAGREMGGFLKLFHHGAGEMSALTLAGFARWVLVESGYLQSLEEEGTLEAESRVRNLEEFLSAASEAESLGLGLPEFLDRVTLASDTDEIEGAADLSLMTIHCAKGLEFPYVFLVGMEEDVFPNRQARETGEGLEEERRLFYVALTRAKSRLTLTGARRRRMMGQELLGMPSRFLRELPAEVLEQPIRWGTELYQGGLGVMAGARGPRTGGGMAVASELARIRGYFDKARLGDPDAHPPGDDEGPPVAEEATTSAPPPPPEVFDGNAWPKGTRIRSPRFGRGVILASTGRGDGLTYTVRFETGEKRIMARFGMLEREG